MTVTIDRNYLTTRKFTYYELLAFNAMSTANPTAPADWILAEMLRLELVEHSSDINIRMADMIMNVVCKYYGITKTDIIGGFDGARKTHLVRARQMVCAHAVRFMHQRTFEMHSGINRNTVQHSKIKCAVLMETEPNMRCEFNEIGEQIKILQLGIQFEFIREFSTDPATDLASINNQNQLS